MSYQAPVVTASGSTFAQLQTLGASGLLDKLILANNVATNAPTVAATISVTGAGQSIVNPTVQATASATGGGQTVAVPTVQATVSVGAATTGSLPAGTYYVGYTWVTASGGETTMGAGSPAASVSSVFTQTSGKQPTVTLPNLPTGATSANIYLSNVNGANTALVLYRKGITQATGATVILDSATYNGTTFAAGVAPPASNTTTGSLAAAATGYYFGYTWVHAHGETTLGSSVSTVTAVAAGNVPQITIPSLPTGATSANIYMSDANGVNTSLKLYAKGVTTTTFNATSATFFGGVAFANATASPASNTTIGAVLPGVYYLNFTEINGIGETTASAESATFTVTSQSNPTVAATGSGSGSGGSLAAGAYFFSYTWVDANGGETTPGTSEVASAVTIAATNTLTVTFNDTFPGWAKSRNLYLTAVGGISGSETLYATGIAGTATTYACNSALWVNGTVASTAAKAVPATSTAPVGVPQVTFPALQTGNIGRNVYVTAPGGASGTETLYATGASSLTFDMAIAVPTNSAKFVVPPTTNSTAYSKNKLEKLRAAKDGNLQNVYKSFRDDWRNAFKGDAMPAVAGVMKLRDAHLVFLYLAQLASEGAVSLDANPGTFSYGTSPIGNVSLKRVWP